MKTRFTSVGRDVNGRDALLHPTAANWWRSFVRLARQRLGVELEIIQARGVYSGSANTHSDGWAIDLRTWRFSRATINAIVALARANGASATWYRPTVGSGPHIHLVVDSGKTRTASSYQTAAVRAGYDGLGKGGKGGEDTHPRPSSWLTGTQGIAAMARQLGPTSNPISRPTTTPTAGGLTMADIDDIMTTLKALHAQQEYQSKQLRAVADGTYSRKALDARNAAIATIVRAAVNASTQAVLSAVGKTGALSDADLQRVQDAAADGIREAIDGATLQIKAGE